MPFKVRAHFDGKVIVPNEPVDLPKDEEFELEVRLTPRTRARRRLPRAEKSITSLSFFGMWADRKDMRDSVAWVRKERERWNERLTPRP